MSLLVDGFKEAIELLISGNDSVYSAIIVTITVSSWSILISLILGLPLGFLLGYYQFKGKTVIKTIVDTFLAFPLIKSSIASLKPSTNKLIFTYYFLFVLFCIWCE
jgi:tungstate transport system permease protein